MKKRKIPIQNYKQLAQSDIPIIRERLLQKQGGLCAICKEPAKTPCLDHEHKKRLKGSGRVRGVLCSACNVFLAKMENNCIRYGIGFKDLPRILRNVVEYIEKKHTRYMHPSEREKPKKLKKSSHNKLKKLYTEEFGRFPKGLAYPKSNRLTIPLKKAYKRIGLKPEFYK